MIEMRSALAVGALLFVGCFSPDLGDGKIACGSGGSCPSGYVCRADNHCWKDGGSDGGAADMASSAACQRAADCSGGAICVPYAANGTVKFHCAAPLAGATLGSSARCAAAGSDASCKSGYCVTDANDAALHLCLYPCLGQNDCGGNNCDPVQPPVLVEGVTAPMFNVCALP
jgi:hypothetical protein